MTDRPTHLEFHGVDMAGGWVRPEGFPAGVGEKVLVDTMDETRRIGRRTRLLRFAPGAATAAPITHDCWEEVYLVSGDFALGGEAFSAPAYACRPPGVAHGPFRSETGCLLFEVHYYAADD